MTKLVVLLMLLCAPALSRDLDGSHANSPLHDWFTSLRNGNGGLCCDQADGHRVEDVDWRIDPNGTYSVRLNGEWTKLEDWQIVKQPNKLGQAVVWIFGGKITCFMPGSLS